jgi:hypothetical protein
MDKWAAVPGYEGIYEVSTDGVFRRLIKRKGARDFKVRQAIRRGYWGVTLTCANGVVKHYRSHRLIWAAFNSPIPPGMQINHKNGAKLDNSLSNLELCTASENTRHAYEVLGHQYTVPPHVPGIKNGRALVTEHQVREIRSLYATGELSQEALGKRYGMKQTTVSQIILRKSWSHIT